MEDKRDFSLEGIIEEMQREHTPPTGASRVSGSGNSALEALRRNMASQQPEMTMFPAPQVYPVDDLRGKSMGAPDDDLAPLDDDYYAAEEVAYAPREDVASPTPQQVFYEDERVGFTEPLQQPAGKPKKEKKQKARHGAGVKKLLIGAAGVLVILTGAAFGYTYAYTGIHFGVQAGAVKVGGLSEEDALKAIDAQAEDILQGQSITLKIYDKEYKVDIKSVTTGLDSSKSAQDAYDYTHKGGALTRVLHTVGALFGGHEVPLSVSLDSTALDKRLDEIAAEALTEPVDPSWSLDGEFLVVDSGKPGVDFNRSKVAKEVTERIRTMNFEAFDVDTTTRDQKSIDIDAIYAEAQSEAQNATVDKSDGKTIIPSVDGVKFDLENARSIIGDGSEQSYRIPVERTPAEVTAEKLAQVLFSDTLASTSTELNSGNKPRTNNVRLACEYINGTILNPGDEFSYNGTVGQRTADRGFKSAGAYSNGQLVDEVGGGVCQPSSTLYMAVLRADLEVTERHNHSFTVSYTPLGQDATVSWGGPDLRFKNNTQYPIKILASQSGGSMSVTLKGTKTSDKTVELKTEVLSTLNFQTVEKTDSSLAPGARKTSQSGTTGYKTATYKTVTENGQTTTTQANSSYYQKRDKIVLVGPEGSTAKPASTTEKEKEQESSGTSESSSKPKKQETKPKPEPEPEPEPDDTPPAGTDPEG